MLFWHDVGLDRPVHPPADNLAVLPAAAQRLSLVRLRAVQGERRAYVPQLHRPIVAAAQHLNHPSDDGSMERRMTVRTRAKEKDEHENHNTAKDNVIYG